MNAQVETGIVRDPQSGIILSIQNGVYHDITNEEYHSGPGVSKSSPRPWGGVLKVLTEGLVTIWVSFWYSTGDFLSRYNLPLYIPSLFLSWL